jgi:3-oxoacyl-[acyl-carrier-protein] synthase-3
MILPFINEPIPYPESGKFEQNGGEVVKIISNNIRPLIEQAITQAKLKPSDIKIVFPHQGSRPTTEAVEKAISEYRVCKDFEEGNFSSASIPKALMKAINQGEIKRGDNLVLAGFGAGMFASIAVVKLG